MSWDGWAQANVPTPLVIGHEFVGEIVEVGAGVARPADRRPGQRRGPPRLRPVPELHGGPTGPVRAHQGRRREPRRARSPSSSRCPATNVWRHPPDIDLDVAAIFDPFGNAVHTALTFPVLGEDVLITGAGPIGLMAAMVARHAGARHVVVTDVSRRTGWSWPARSASTLRRRRHATTPRRRDGQLDMQEGFDVGLRCPGVPVGAARHAGQHDPRRQGRHARAAQRDDSRSTGPPSSRT